MLKRIIAHRPPYPRRRSIDLRRARVTRAYAIFFVPCGLVLA